MKLSTILFLCLLLTALGCDNAASDHSLGFASLSEQEKRLPENAKYAMELYPGLQIGTFAAEPMIVNPTNLDIDERGRIWMCEATNYRMRFNPQNPYRDAGDRVLILEDTTGDGRADIQKVFYQGEDINAALGIAVLGDRVYVSHSPSILILQDLDGDDVADTKDTLFTGIGGPQDDHGVHAITFGPDGKLYFNFGNAGKQLLHKDGSPVLDQEGRPMRTGGEPYWHGVTFRCDPDGSNLEVIGHNFRNIYEVAVDSYGAPWQSDNDDDGNRGVRINYVMDYGNYGYRDALTGDSWRVRRVGMHEEIPKRHWHLNDPGVVPNLLQTGSGSPCGMVVYEGSLLPAVFQGEMIHCEAGHQVVRAYPVRRVGAGYQAEVVNLLKSEDLWFRPSDVCTAPDGSIFVSDWYDSYVGGNVMNDPDRGRIYRIAPKAMDYRITPPDVETIDGAMEALLSPNMSTRYLAWNRLHQAGQEAESALLDLYEHGDPHEQARAFWLLVRISGKTDHYIRQALTHENTNLQIAGLRAARYWSTDKIPMYVASVLEAEADVRREAAVSLRYQGTEQAAKLWTKLAQQHDGSDRWYLEALGIGADKHPSYVETYLRDNQTDPSTLGYRDIVWRMAVPSTLPLLKGLIEDQDVPKSELPRYFRAFHFHSPEDRDAVLAGLIDLAHPWRDTINAMAVGAISADYANAHPAVRQKVIDLLPSMRGTPQWLSVIASYRLHDQVDELWEEIQDAKDEEIKAEMLTTFFRLKGAPIAEQALQTSVSSAYNEIIATVGRVNHPDATQLLWQQLQRSDLELGTRKRVADALANSGQGLRFLHEVAQRGDLDSALHTTVGLRMLTAWNTDLRSYGAELLGPAASESGDPLPAIAELVLLDGDITAGRNVFDTYCATCHQVQATGIEFGPDLSEIGSKLGRKALYSAILYPSGGISFGYEGYELTTTDGSEYTGYISSENAQEIVLRLIGGVSRTFARSEIQSMVEIPTSLMTPDLQRVMKQQDLVDLVQYLESLKSTLPET